MPAASVRMLNRRKGRLSGDDAAPRPIVKLYAAAMQTAIGETANLSVIEGEADELIVSNGRVTGIRLGEGGGSRRCRGHYHGTSCAD